MNKKEQADFEERLKRLENDNYFVGLGLYRIERKSMIAQNSENIVKLGKAARDDMKRNVDRIDLLIKELEWRIRKLENNEEDNMKSS
jgi:hypothetical protein